MCDILVHTYLINKSGTKKTTHLLKLKQVRATHNQHTMITTKNTITPSGIPDWKVSIIEELLLNASMQVN